MADPPKVFISYAHKDAKFLKLLQTILKPMVREDRIYPWADTLIEPSGKWREEIAEAIDTADFAILLVSDNFLESDFIAEKELPPLLERKPVYWVLVSDCLWKKTPIEAYNAAAPTEVPLDQMSVARRKTVLRKMCEKLLDACERGDHLASSASRLFLAPFPRNPFFTGREEFLDELHEALASGGAAAISGLGGIGKTQTAVEYAYRHRDEYQYVLWVTASEASTTTSGYGEIARRLGLPEAGEADEQVVVEAVKRWLETHEDWLLVLDNVDEPEALESFLPHNPLGHIIVTTRAQVVQVLGIAREMDLGVMTPWGALRFLLRRTGREECDGEELRAAAVLAVKLGCLPLALEQAAAYIAAKQCRFAAYLQSYEQRELALLEKQKPIMGKYPHSVVTTWAANFGAVQEASLLKEHRSLAPTSLPRSPVLPRTRCLLMNSSNHSPGTAS